MARVPKKPHVYEFLDGARVEASPGLPVLIPHATNDLESLKKTAKEKRVNKVEQEARTPVTKMTIERIAFKARKMLTIDWDSGWKSGDAVDAFVRIRPPPEATDQQVQQVRREVFQAGAAAIRILPRQKAAVLVEKKDENVRKRETHREACLALVETVATRDREALKTEVEAVMAKVGL